jgi:transcriptional regulator with XRE-family HTH domain
MEISPGNFLREVRMRLQLGLRDVQKLSAKVAAKERNKRFYISAARLTQIENDNAIPSMFKTFTLATIYGLSFNEILSRYGVDSDRTHRYREQIRLSVTRPVSAELCNPNTKVTVPIRLDPTFRWESTQLINRVVAFWGEIPAAFLLDCNPKEHTFAYIGLEDKTMYPLLRPGSLVMVDGERRQVVSGTWNSIFERPIYLVELRDGYLCGWCHVSESRVTILSYPTSNAPPRTFSLATEAEVIGQVVAVAMRLVPPQARTNPVSSTTPPAQS